MTGRRQSGWIVLGCWVALSQSIIAEAGEGDAVSVAERFQRLTRQSVWRSNAAVPLRFDTFHPQGMIRVGERFFLSSVEVLDRDAGQGHGHLFEFSPQGELLRHRTLSEGAAYHPGGLDFDGEQLWIPVAEYRPDSWSVVFRVDPDTLEVERVFDFDDHLGAIVCDPEHRRLVAASWGSRRLYRWELNEEGDRCLDPKHPTTRPNPSQYVDFQDGQHLPGTSYALFGGLAGLPPPTADAPRWVLGGLELVDLRDLRPVHQLPVTLQTPRFRSLTQNAWTVRPRGKGLQFFFVPEDNQSTLFVYDVEP